MYKTVADAVKYVKEFRGLVKDVSNVEIVLAPTFTALHAAADLVPQPHTVELLDDVVDLLGCRVRFQNDDHGRSRFAGTPAGVRAFSIT